MNKLLAKGFALVLCSFVLSTELQANLIQNGGFEETDVKTGRWNWFKSEDVNGWSGSNIEIWDNLGRFDAFEGSQHIELNSHGVGSNENFSIFQSFKTTVGAIYDVSFAYAARRSNKEAFQFELFSGDTKALVSELITDHVKNTWSVYKTSFTATSIESTLEFTAVFPEYATVGNFLDDIAVYERPQPVQFSAPRTANVLAANTPALLSRTSQSPSEVVDVPVPRVLAIALVALAIIAFRRKVK